MKDTDKETALHDLAGRYLEGIASRDDVARLQAALDADPLARRLFLELCNLDSALDLQAAEWRESQAVEPANAGRRPWLRTAAVIAVSAAVAALTMVFLRTGDDATHYDNHEMPITTVASLRDPGPDGATRQIAPSTLAGGEGKTQVRSAHGVDIRLDDDAVFGFSTAERGALYAGSVQAWVEEPTASFSVLASNLRIVDLGTAFRVDRVDDEHVSVTVLDGEVEVQSRVRVPVAYWPFDDVAAPHGDGWGRTAEVVSGLDGRIGPGTGPRAGLVGPGGLRCDNSETAGVRIEGGTGDKVGLGSLACVEGITLEAVIVSEWSGAFDDYDTIYRKEDGPCRVLLSLQNDGRRHSGYAEPLVAPGPCLSFGLHLAGQGYRELDMPLDGLDGRPTLAELTDGRAHHVVAAYDSFSGRKAIFVDGRKRFEHAYPVGTLILSGGPAPATIGNHGHHRGAEPFTGVIDEVAVYDFGLTAAEVAAHHAHVAEGKTFFGTAPPAPGGPRWRAVTRLVEGQSATFHQQTGLPR